MTRFAVAVVVAIAALPAPQDDEPTLLRKCEAAFNLRQYAEVRRLAEDFERRFPKSDRLPEALMWQTYGYDKDLPEQKRAAIEILRRILEQFPDSLSASHAHPRRQELDPWTFSTFQSTHRAGHTDLYPSRTWGPASAFVVRHAGVDVLKAAFRKSEPGGDLYGSIDVSSWEVVKTARIEYPFYEHQARNLEIDFAKAGMYSVEETIDGFTNRSWIRVSSFSLTAKALGGEVIAFAADPESGAGVKGVNLLCRWEKGSAERTTDADGIARFAPGGEGRIFAWKGDEAHLLWFEGHEADEESLCYVTTDRPVYRPGHTVHFKAVRRDRKGEALTRPAAGTVRVELKDPNGRVLAGGDYAWTAAGSVSGSFTIGAEPRLGEYAIVAHVKKKDGGFSWDEDEPVAYWRKTFVVAEYRKPEFRVEVKASKGTAVDGEAMKAVIKAEYYFGGPVPDAAVEWELVRRWAWCDWCGTMGPSTSRSPRPPFEDQYAWLYQRDRDPDDGYDGETIKADHGTTGADGTLAVSVDIPTSRYPCTYVLRATVRDLSRLSADGEASIPSGPSDLRLMVGATRMFYRQGDRIAARARVTDAEGRPAAGREVVFAGFRAVEEPSDQPEFGRTVEYESFFTGTAKTDASGLVAMEFAASESGSIRVRARVKDDQERTAEDRAELFVAGDGMPEESGDDLQVLPDKIVYEEGETARLLVRSPEKGLNAFLTIEGGRFHDARVIPLRKRCEVVEIPLRGAFAPNVYVKLMAWKDQRSFGGGHEILVLPKAQMIDVEVTTDRPTYGPRERAKVIVKTTSKGAPLAAEVELGVVDEAIFAVKRDETKDIRRFFRALREDAATISGSWVWNDRCASFRRSMGAALTGAAFALEEGAPQAEPAGFAPTETRRWFPDTLAYLAHVTTDANGRAELEIGTPDTLTEWRFTGRAVAGDDRFGWTTSKAVTRKDVICRLIAPRFWTERDEGSVTTVVHNDLDRETEFLVRLTVDGAVREKKLTVASKGIGRLDWPVKAEAPGAIILKAEALSAAMSDAMELTVPVNPHGMRSQAMASGRVAGTWKTTLTLPERTAGASVEIVATSSTAGAIREALPFLAGYPYG
jgi:hypothetical protein